MKDSKVKLPEKRRIVSIIMNSSVRTYKVNRIDSQKRLINAVFLVGVARLELAASTSQMSRPTIWATPRNIKIFSYLWSLLWSNDLFRDIIEMIKPSV